MSKTGTKSLSSFLNNIGVWCCHYPSPKYIVEGRYEAAVGRFDAATDSSVAIAFRDLDEAFPGSLFILTTRPNTSRWIDSCRLHFSERSTKNGDARSTVRERLFGTNEPASQTQSSLHRRYAAHQSSILDHFRDRPFQLVEIDLTDGNNIKNSTVLLRAITRWAQTMSSRNRKTCSKRLSLLFSRLQSRERTSLWPVVPQIRNQIQYRRRCLCFVRFTDRDDVFVAGYVEKILRDRQTEGRTRRYARRYAVVHNRTMRFYSTSQCIVSRGCVHCLNECVIELVNTQTIRVKRRQMSIPVVTGRTAPVLEFRAVVASDTKKWIMAMTSACNIIADKQASARKCVF